MIHERLDKKVRAKVLAVNGDEVLINAFWPASSADYRNGFQVINNLAYNIVNVSRAYFERKYGVAL